MIPRTARRGGFTLVEMACATVLTGLLGALCLLCWKAFGVPAIDAYHRARLAGEAMMISASLAADLGGYLPSPYGPSGGRDEGRLVGWRESGGVLELWYDAADPDGTPPDGATEFVPPDLHVAYWVAVPPGSREGVLMRMDPITGAAVAIASGLSAMEAEAVGDRLILRFEFSYRLQGAPHRRTYVFEAIKP